MKKRKQTFPHGQIRKRELSSAVKLSLGMFPLLCLVAFARAPASTDAASVSQNDWRAHYENDGFKVVRKLVHKRPHGLNDRALKNKMRSEEPEGKGDGKGKGKGSSVPSKSYKSSRISSKSSKSSKSKKSSSDNIFSHSKSYGKGADGGDNGNGGGDNGNGGGDNGNGGGDNGNGGGDNGNGGDNGGKETPSPSSPGASPAPSAPESPTTDAPTPTAGRDPPTVPPGPTAPPNEEPRCSVGSTGLFGSEVGIQEVSEFSYQTTVVPSVTATELNLDILGKIETAMAPGILSDLFQQCSLTATSISSGVPQRSRTTDRGEKHHRFRLRRGLQSATIEGFSTRPRDTVVEGEDCVNTEPVFPCFVIRGRVTIYSDSKLSDAELAEVEASIKESIENSNLESVDNRVLAVTYRDINEFPLPEDPDGGGPGDDDEVPNGGGPTDDEPNGVIPDADGGVKLEVWQIVLIALACVALVGAMAFCWFKRPSHEKFDSDDSSSSDDDEAKSGSSGDDGDDDDRKSPGGSTPEYQPPPPMNSVERDTTETEPLQSASSTPAAAAAAATAAAVATNDGNNALATTTVSAHSHQSSQFEEESASSSGSRSGSGSQSGSGDGEEEPSNPKPNSGDQSNFTLDLEDTRREDPSAITSDFSNTNTYGNDLTFGASNAYTKPALETASEEFSSEYSEEEVDEEYEIEYVEEGANNGAQNAAVGESASGEFWEDETTSDGS